LSEGLKELTHEINNYGFGNYNHLTINKYSGCSEAHKVDTDDKDPNCDSPIIVVNLIEYRE